MFNKWYIGEIYQIIPNILAFTAHFDITHTEHDIKKYNYFYFSTDLHEKYHQYCLDFGPITYDVIIEFCKVLNLKLNDKRLQNRLIIYYCDYNEIHRTNAVFLLAVYLLLEKKYSVDEALMTFINIKPYPFLNYRDASYNVPLKTVSLKDCLYGLDKALKNDLIKYDRLYNIYYRQLYVNDYLNYHYIADKFIAFQSPEDIITSVYSRTPKEYLEKFLILNVSNIVRLNEPLYDKKIFIDNNIEHHDLYFDDCTTPSEKIIINFLKICMRAKGKIAVHCKSGIGRTGTLIAIWLILKYNFTAKEAIAYLRIIRSGCIIALQQEFLENIEIDLKNII